jgi:hypothetical protein
MTAIIRALLGEGFPLCFFVSFVVKQVWGFRLIAKCSWFSRSVLSAFISGKVLPFNFGDFWQFWHFWQSA